MLSETNDQGVDHKQRLGFARPVFARHLRRLRELPLRQLPLLMPLIAAGALFALPFLNPRHYEPLPAFYAEWIAAVLLLAAGMLLLARSTWQRPLVPAIVLLPAGLACIALLQQILGQAGQRETQLLYLLYLLAAALAMIVGQALRQRFGLARVAETLASWLLVGALASAMLTIVSLYSPQLLPGLVEHDQGQLIARGNLMQRNHLANYLWMGVAAATFLHLSRRLNGYWLVAAVAPLLLVEAMSGSKSVLLYLAGTFALASLWYWRSRGREARRLMLIALLLVPAFFGIQYLAEILGGAGRFPTTAGQLSGEVSAVASNALQAPNAFSVRLFLIKMALAIWREAPVFGNGVGSFPWHSFVLAVDYPAGFQGHGEHAHNIFAQVLAELGLAGFLVLVTTAALWCRRLAKEEWNAAHVWILLVLMVESVHSMLEYPLWYAYFLLPTALLAGAADTRAVSLRPTISLRGSALMVILLGAMVLNSLRSDYLHLEHVVYPGLDASREKGRPQTFGEVNPVLLDIERKSLLAPYVRLMYAANLTPNRELLAGKLLMSESAMHFAPATQIVFKHALLLALAGRTDEAHVQLRRAVRGYPDSIAQFVEELNSLKAKAKAQGSDALPYDGLLRAAESEAAARGIALSAVSSR